MTTVLRTVLDIVESHIDEELIESVVADAFALGAVTEGQLVRRLPELDDSARSRAARVLTAVRP